MNTTNHRSITSLSRAAAILLTLGLFTIGSIPNIGHAFPGILHWIAHIAAYALIAYAFGLGWPQWPALLIVASVAAIGAIHEVTEIITHSHALEAEDAIVNTIGVVIGVAIQRITQRTIIQ